MLQENLTKLNLVPNEVAVNLNMLGALVEDWILSKMNGGFVVAIERGRRSERNTKISQEALEPRQLRDSMDRYSASADERATTVCFLLRHVTRLPPKKVQYPLVERRSSTDRA